MKKIVFAVTNDITQDRRMIRICTTLHKNGYEVELVGRQLPHSAPLTSYAFRTHRISCIFNKGPKFYAEFNIRLFWYLKKCKADIYGAIDYDTLKGVTKAARSLGKKIVFDAHEWFEEVPELEGREKVKKYWKRIAKNHIPRTNLNYTVSEGIAEKLSGLYFRPFEVIHNYPVLRPGVEPSAIREDIIVYVGVLNKGRGLPEIIKAMHDINGKLWIVGDGDIREELWRLVSSENLLHKIIFKGFVAPEDLDGLLRQARVGLNLLDGKSQSYKYSLANKFFDYIHAGTPQVFMDFPEYERYNREHRIGASIMDLRKDSLVYAINHLLSDRNYWFNFHVTCLHARKIWCWQKEERKLLGLLEKL
jgi:glycosyltransferase involved in cell wall biosynthesis